MPTSLQTLAIARIRGEVKSGRMPPVTDQSCVDCGATAAAYHHHLGYHRRHWLDVVPVCDKCHGQRHAGPRSRPTTEEHEVMLSVRLTRTDFELLQEAATLERRSLFDEASWACHAWAVRVVGYARRRAEKEAKRGR